MYVSPLSSCVSFSPFRVQKDKDPFPDTSSPLLYPLYPLRGALVSLLHHKRLPAQHANPNPNPNPNFPHSLSKSSKKVNAVKMRDIFIKLLLWKEERARRMASGEEEEAASIRVPKLSVNGEGRVSVKPQVVSVRVGVSNEKETAAEALGENNTVMNRVTTRVRALGVEERDIVTSNLSLQPVQRYEDVPRPHNTRNGGTERRPIVVGFRASNEITLSMRLKAAAGKDGDDESSSGNNSSIGAVLSALVTEGVTNIRSINFVAEDTKREAEAAMAIAVDDARRKADVLAAAAGYKVAGIIEINAHNSGAAPLHDGGGGGPPVMRAMMMEDVPVSEGELVVSTNVDVIYALEALTGTGH